MQSYFQTHKEVTEATEGTEDETFLGEEKINWNIG